jgi:ABC-type multidrug transport system ATPase subunit
MTKIVSARRVVCIILGGSGSGKTTLLNTIAGRMIGPEIITSGDIRYNGQRPKKFWSDGSIGYLQQNDFLMPFLT